MLPTLLLRITSPLGPARRLPLESNLPSIRVNAGVISSSSSEPPTSAPAGSCSLRSDYATMCLYMPALWSGPVSLAPLVPRRLRSHCLRARPGVVYFEFILDLCLASWPRSVSRLRLCFDRILRPQLRHCLSCRLAETRRLTNDRRHTTSRRIHRLGHPATQSSCARPAPDHCRSPTPLPRVGWQRRLAVSFRGPYPNSPARRFLAGSEGPCH
jgi:hypothetical protein